MSITVRFSSPQQQAMHATENRLTRISLAIVWMFIFCHIWKLIPTVYEAITAEEVSSFLAYVLSRGIYIDPPSLGILGGKQP